MKYDEMNFDGKTDIQTIGVRSSPVMTAMFISISFSCKTALRAAAHACGFTPPALVTIRIPELNEKHPQC